MFSPVRAGKGPRPQEHPPLLGFECSQQGRVVQDCAVRRRDLLTEAKETYVTKDSGICRRQSGSSRLSSLRAFVFSSGVKAAGTMGTKQACISRFCLANSARLDPKKGVFTWNGQRYYICYEQDRPQVGGTAGFDGADTTADTIEYGAPPPFSSSLALRGRRRLAAFACILLRRRWKERVSRSGLV